MRCHSFSLPFFAFILPGLLFGAMLHAQELPVKVIHLTDPLTVVDGASGDELGFSLSVDGAYAVAGAYQDDDKGTTSGAAYIFHRVGEKWVEQTKLLAEDGAPSDFLGWSSAISEDYVLVGAYGDDEFGRESGAAYVFHRQGESWVQQAKLLPSDGAEDDLFGWSVAISGEYALVGAYSHDHRGENSGAAYLFHRQGDSWTQEAKLVPKDAIALDGFGFSVAIRGDYALIGAIGRDDRGANSGAAYIFHRTKEGWAEQQMITAPDGQSDDLLGFSVAIDSRYAIMSAVGDDDSGGNAGAVYVYQRVGNQWTFSQHLLAEDGASFDRFGHDVAFEGAYLVVGAEHAGQAEMHKGAAYLYQNQEGKWQLEAKLIPANGKKEDGFGYSVGLSGSQVLIGARRYDVEGINEGTVYIFSIE